MKHRNKNTTLQVQNTAYEFIFQAGIKPDVGKCVFGLVRNVRNCFSYTQMN